MIYFVVPILRKTHTLYYILVVFAGIPLNNAVYSGLPQHMSSNNSFDKTILLVDDSLIILDRINEIVEGTVKSCRILLARNISDALLILQHEKIDIAIIDIHLEKENGMDLLGLISNKYPGIAVIMCTNQVSLPVQTACRKLGARHFIDKSNEFELIAPIIDSLL